MRMIVLILICVILDQASKFLAETYLLPRGSVTIIDGVLDFTYAENTGAAFSILRGRQDLFIWITALAVLVMLFLLIRYRTKLHPFARWSMILLVGGALGNLIDRVIRGYVVDFINVTFVDFAIFNISDICTVLGCIGLVIYLLFSEFHKESETREKKKGTDRAVNLDQDRTALHSKASAGQGKTQPTSGPQTASKCSHARCKKEEPKHE